MRRVLPIASTALLALTACFGFLGDAIRGPHVSTVQVWLIAVALSVLVTGAFFGMLIYFWGHPALRRPV